MPTEADLVTLLGHVTNIDHEARKFANDNGADDFVSLQDTLTGALVDTQYAAEMTAGVNQKRAALAALITNSAPLDALLQDFGEFIGSNAPDSQGIIDDLIRYMLANSKTIKRRGFTTGAVTLAGGNVGDGRIVRLTTDVNALEIEARGVGAYTARCVGDANTGTERSNEEFLFQAPPPGKDAVAPDTDGSGLVRVVEVSSPRKNPLLNASFDQFGGTAAAPSSITSWSSSTTVDSATYEFDDTLTYLPPISEDVTVYSLQIKATTTLTQRLDKIGLQVDQFQPYWLSLPWNRDGGSATGTLEVHMGAISNSVVLAAQAGWNELDIVAAPDETLFYKAWAEEAPDIKIVWTSTGGTYFNIDDMNFAGMFNHDGSWYVILPGATPFRAGNIEDDTGDTASWTDSIASDSIIQRWFWRHYGRYLPHSATPTWADPT